MPTQSRGHATRRLLIVACSQRKNPAKGLLPAIERYDGPAFRVLRKYLREEGGGEALTVLILSAKYGLIAAHREIPDYDCRLSKDSAIKLRPHVLETALSILRAGECRSVGICVGRDYRMAVDGLSEMICEGVRVAMFGGGLGRRLTALRDWLQELAV